MNSVKQVSMFGVLVLMLLFLNGCATRQVDNYLPTNNIVYTQKNSVAVGKFTYSAVETKGMRKDQIENTALINLYLGKPIAEIVEKATILELQKTGLKIDNNVSLTIIADIMRIKAADLGFTVNWTYEILYKIINKDTNETLFSRSYHPPMMTTRKLFMSQATFVSFVHKLFLQGYEMFIRDPNVREILDSPRP